MLAHKQLRALVLGMACTAIALSIGLIVGGAVWAGEQKDNGFMAGIEFMMFLPLGICLLLGGLLETRVVMSGDCCSPRCNALVHTACHRVILGVLALVVFGATVNNKTVEPSDTKLIKTRTTYGQPSWMLCLVCTAGLGVTSLLTAIAELMLIRSQRRQQRGVTEGERQPQQQQLGAVA